MCRSCESQIDRAATTVAATLLTGVLRANSDTALPLQSWLTGSYTLSVRETSLFFKQVVILFFVFVFVFARVEV